MNMKTTEFEDAIIMMDSRIVLDEVKINKGHVRRFYGHTGHRLIMWDEKGRGYSFFFRQEINHTTHEKLPESFYVRDCKYDIFLITETPRKEVSDEPTKYKK
jgi:hypothetical protein